MNSLHSIKRLMFAMEVVLREKKSDNYLDQLKASWKAQAAGDNTLCCWN